MQANNISLFNTNRDNIDNDNLGNIDNRDIMDISDRKKTISIFDMDNESGFEEIIKFPFNIDVSNFGQLTYLNELYLCGSDAKKEDFHIGSHFIKFNLNSSNITHLVSTIYNHNKPSLINYFNEDILCIGGKYNVKCEIYLCKYAKWRNLPDLPEM